MPRGIDISEFNGYVNIDQLDPDFVIIRAGDGKYWDVDVFENIEKCRQAGIPYGLYWLIRDWSIAEAEKTSTDLCGFALSQPVPPSVGIWCDVEDEYDDDPSRAIPFVDAFCRTVEDVGFYAGIYCNQHYHTSLYPALERYDCWIAFWDDDPKYDPGFGTMKQYSTSGGRMDLDVSFVDLDVYQLKEILIHDLSLEDRVRILEDKIKILEDKLK